MKEGVTQNPISFFLISVSSQRQSLWGKERVLQVGLNWKTLKDSSWCKDKKIPRTDSLSLPFLLFTSLSISFSRIVFCLFFMPLSFFLTLHISLLPLLSLCLLSHLAVPISSLYLSISLSLCCSYLSVLAIPSSLFPSLTPARVSCEVNMSICWGGDWHRMFTHDGTRDNAFFLPSLKRWCIYFIPLPLSQPHSALSITHASSAAPQLHPLLFELMLDQRNYHLHVVMRAAGLDKP